MRAKGLWCLVVGAIWLFGAGCALAADSPHVPSSGRLPVPEQEAPSVAPISPMQPVAPGNAVPGALQPNASLQEYVLGVGDRFRMTVYGEDDLSGEYEVSSTGIAALPLIGNVQAAGQTIRAFEQMVRSKLAEGYLHDPRVSVQISNYRPFFILGEVSKPGGYPYVNGMTVLNAVALAGGYTYRADKSGATIVHASDPNKTEQAASEDAAVKPGDIIRVPERFF
jgi:protein involved in polysaccharide export with SLBB domain